MQKWLYGVLATIVAAIGVSIWTDAHDWVKARNEDHEILRQLVWKSEFLNGKIPEAPVAYPAK